MSDKTKQNKANNKGEQERGNYTSSSGKSGTAFATTSSARTSSPATGIKSDPSTQIKANSSEPSLLGKPQGNTERTGNQKNTAEVIVRFDVGFSNRLYIRGQGNGLNWQKGQEMENVGPDRWRWIAKNPTTGPCEFKVLINDSRYETGSNHRLNQGEKAEYTPHF